MDRQPAVAVTTATLGAGAARAGDGPCCKARLGPGAGSCGGRRKTSLWLDWLLPALTPPPTTYTLSWSATGKMPWRGTGIGASCRGVGEGRAGGGAWAELQRHGARGPGGCAAPGPRRWRGCPRPGAHLRPLLALEVEHVHPAVDARRCEPRLGHWPLLIGFATQHQQLARHQHGPAGAAAALGQRRPLAPGIGGWVINLGRQAGRGGRAGRVSGWSRQARQAGRGAQALLTWLPCAATSAAAPPHRCQARTARACRPAACQRLQPPSLVQAGHSRSPGPTCR